MSRLEYLSQFSNAVLTPELNTVESMQQQRIQHGGRAYMTGVTVGKHELKYRKAWCAQQFNSIGEFGAVLAEKDLFA